MPTVSCHELRFRRVLPLTMNIFLLLSPLTACALSLHTLSLALTLSLSLALLAGTLGQHPRYTATRSGVAALASSPAVSARRRNSFLPACLLACLLAYLSAHPRPFLLPSFPLFTLSLACILTCLLALSRQLPSCLRSLSP